jgi:hypothetical protein
MLVPRPKEQGRAGKVSIFQELPPGGHQIMATRSALFVRIFYKV